MLTGALRAVTPELVKALCSYDHIKDYRITEDKKEKMS
jgi:hypothetical protein